MARRAVYGVVNVPPEISAYATVRCSRSADSMKESIDWIYRQSADAAAGKAEHFLETYYFQYGHRSIADCGHVTMAIEQWSQLMAEEVEDEPLWDGQEQSTRYQDFSRPKFWKPRGWTDRGLMELYLRTIHDLFAAYHRLSRRMVEVLSARHPRPQETKPADYDRALRARAFDVARYLLPMATLTNVGQIVSIRTLERQIGRLRSSRYPEIRLLAEQMAAACKEPAHDVVRARCGEAIKALPVCSDFLPPTAIAPTLAKHLEPDWYLERTRAALQAFVKGLSLNRDAPETTGRIDLYRSETDLVFETMVTALYWVSHWSYRQVRRTVLDFVPEQKHRLWAILFQHRGKHDELLRLFRSGYPLIYDTCVDIGADRDLKRHRRCVQIRQDLSPVYGYEVPPILKDPECAADHDDFVRVVEATHAAYRVIGSSQSQDALYVLPLATRRRRLYKMDPAEALYIAELRTGVGGHFSYRSAAWQMYVRLVKLYPAFCAFEDPRVTHPSVEAPLQR